MSEILLIYMRFSDPKDTTNIHSTVLANVFLVAFCVKSTCHIEARLRLKSCRMHSLTRDSAKFS